MTASTPTGIDTARPRFLARADLVVIILLAGLALRLVYVANVVTIPWNDMYEYHDIAREVAGGGEFGRHGRFPLFIMVTAALYRLLGSDPLLPRLWNVFCSVALMYVIYRITLVVSRRSRVALLALAVAAVHPDLVLYCGPVLYEMTMMLFIALTVYVVVCRQWYAAGGACLALAVLAKPTNIVLLPLLLARREARAPWRQRLLPLLLVFVAAMLPWWVRNCVEYRAFLPSGPSAGLTFYAGNHPGQVNAVFTEPEIKPEMRYYRELTEIYARYDAQYRRRACFIPPEADKYFILEALACIRNRPGEAAAGYVRKFATFLSARHCWFLDYYYSFGLTKTPLPELLMISLLAFAFYAFLTGWRDDRLRFLFITVISYGLFYSLFTVLTRYRLAILPFTIVAAAIGFARFARDLRARPRARAALLALLLILFTLITFAI